MRRALEVAAKARGCTSPNPMVGAVLVKNGEIIAEGWHECAGLAHAERVALLAAGENSRGADMYVTLEPCCHNGRTGPCTEAIIAAGIKKVYVAVRDPNPVVNGKGIAMLKNAGIEVEEDLLAEDAQLLNEIFFKWVLENSPFVIAKYAMSLDGKIATVTGDSKWISSEQSRAFTHQLRNDCDAILVGSGTVKIDDPALTCRLPGGKQPVRVIVDSRAGIELTSQLLCDGLARTIVAVTENAPAENIKRIMDTGAEVAVLPSREERVDLSALLKYLGGQNITSVLVEGGATLHASMLSQGLVDKLYVFIAPIIISGKTAPGPVGGIGWEKVADAWQLSDVKMEKIGPDIMVSGYIK